MRTTRIAAAVIAALALLSSARLAWVSWRLLQKSGRPDEITEYESRFEQARKALPPGSIVGYVTDQPYPVALFDIPTITKFHWCRYAMTPVIVVREPGRELILGNFSDPRALSRLSGDPELRTVRDFGQGVVLFQRERRR